MEYGGVGREDKYSRMGIASLVLAILVGVLVFLIIGGAGLMEASTPGGMDEDSPLVALIGFSPSSVACSPTWSASGSGSLA